MSADGTPVNPDVLAGAMSPAEGYTVGRSISTAPLDKRYQERVEDNQDLFCVVSDYHNRRGTGKSVFSLLLGDHFDRTDEGLTLDKCTLSADKLLDAYTDQPRGSALVLDEAEAQASKYNASTKLNKALREKVSMARVEEKYVIMNMPMSDELDRDLLKLADVWVLVTRKGQAWVHLLANNPYSSKLLTPKSELVEWGDIPLDTHLREIYNELTAEKRRRLRGESGDGTLYNEKELRAEIEQAEKRATRATRDDIIRGLVNAAGLSPTAIAPAFDVKRARISQIANEKGD